MELEDAVSLGEERGSLLAVVHTDLDREGGRQGGRKGGRTREGKISL